MEHDRHQPTGLTVPGADLPPTERFPDRPADTRTDTPLPHPAAGWPRVRGYEILSRVGSGGMGVVYKARHRELRRTVALKTLRGTALSDVEFRDRFQAEAEAVARLQHPNVVQVFEVGITDPRPGETVPSPYIAFEFVDGGSLADRTDAPQPPREAARLVETLARAAHAAHRLGVVHRDLKPANVLLTPAGEPKIADFGVAKRLGDERDTDGRGLTRMGTAVGTPEYMAPEQVCGGPTTPAIDTYALGVILYELLTGRVPFHGVDGAATMDMAWRQEPVSPRRLQPGMPKDLETVCLKCLDKVPGRRYPSAEALADDLRRWLDGRPILARPVGPVGKTARWVGRNPAVASLAAAVVAVGLIGLLGVTWNLREARAHAAAERWQGYRARILAATSALRLDDARTARRSLEAAPAEHLGWEWYYAAGRLDVSSRTFTAPATFGARGFVGPGSRRASLAAGDAVHVWDTTTGRLIGSVANADVADRYTCSPDGLTVAHSPTAPDNDVVNLWDVPSGAIRATLRGHPARSNTAHFSPDGRLLATGGVDGSVRVWDVATGALRYSPGGHTRTIGNIVFDRDGRRMATPGTTDGSLQVWDVASGRRLHRLHVPGSDMINAAFNPADPDLLAVYESVLGNRIRLWRLSTGKPVAELAPHKNRVTQFEFSPDGTRLVTASLDQTVRLWEVPTARLISEKRHAGKVMAAQFDPSGTRLVTASQDQTVRLWDATTGAALAVLHGHTGEVLDAGFTADGMEIVSVARDDTVKVWEVARVERAGAVRGHGSFVYGATFLPDGRRVASASWDGTVRLWDAGTGREERVLPHTGGKAVSWVAAHPAGKWLASLGRDGFVRLWDADAGELLHHWPVTTHGWLDGRLAFNPTGDLLAVGAGKEGVRLFDPHTRAVVADLPCPTEAGRDVTFSPDGRWLAAGGDDKDPTLRVWDVARRGEPRVLKGHAERVYAVAFAPDGKLLVSGSTDGTVRLWDAATWEQAIILRPDAPVYGLAFTPDGKRLAAGCADNTIRLWDVSSWEEVGGLTGHADYVHAVAFSPDGRRLVSGSGDATLRVWDAHQPPDARPSQPSPAE